MITENERKKLMMETVGHVRQLKERINDLRCDTDSSERTLSFLLEDASGHLDEKVERDLGKIDNLLEDVANKLKLRDLLARKDHSVELSGFHNGQPDLSRSIIDNGSKSFLQDIDSDEFSPKRIQVSKTGPKPTDWSTKPDDLQDEKFLPNLLDSINKILCYSMENLPNKTEEDIKLKNLIDDLLKKVDDMSEIYPKDAQEIFDVANMLEKYSAANSAKHPNLSENIKTCGDKLRLWASTALLVSSDADMNKLEEQMDSLLHIIDEGRTPKSELHDAKINLQEYLLDALEDANQAEQFASDAVCFLKPKTARNLAEKKKKFAKFKTDLGLLKTSKGILSTKWRKFGELQKKFGSATKDLQELASNSPNLLKT